MNMITALQNLYKAVSGEDNHKRNISKLLCDIHYAITGGESPVKNNWSRIIDSMATNWPEGGGGGNPNLVETITGTFANPFGDYNIADLGTWLLNNEVSIVLKVTTQAGVATIPLFSTSERSITARFGYASDSELIVVSAYWISTGLDYCDMAQGANGSYVVESVKSMASQFPTVATIIWHPLPAE